MQPPRSQEFWAGVRAELLNSFQENDEYPNSDNNPSTPHNQALPGGR
jgi:hypothetical protein